jgi:hypothetical protein
MARPRGHPKSGGRKKGTPNKATLVRQQELAARGELPLDSMLSVMRDETADVRRRDAMAVAAAPYVHPRLATIPHRREREANPDGGECRIRARHRWPVRASRSAGQRRAVAAGKDGLSDQARRSPKARLAALAF